MSKRGKYIDKLINLGWSDNLPRDPFATLGYLVIHEKKFPITITNHQDMMRDVQSVRVVVYDGDKVWFQTGFHITGQTLEADDGFELFSKMLELHVQHELTKDMKFIER